ncbi:hypothetical protein ACIBQX_46750 [Nonomuraea sp. NPDC049714]|uniref:hypothetical protein n=1 Tax=Nonomuraea sp. NPDC049714 TaxID=3364357 RepID=UPI0037876B34
MTEDTLPTADRVAGLLVLLFAQQVSRIALLTRSRIHHRDDGRTELSLGATTVVLPGPLADLINQLPTLRSEVTARHLHDGTWLFPGQPRHPSSLSRRLTQLGIDARPDHNSVLLAYARYRQTPWTYAEPASGSAEVTGIPAMSGSRTL